MGKDEEFREVDIYRITIKGVLDEKWSEWFDGFSITPSGEDETVLIGPIIDQGSLHGLLAKFRDLGLAIISVNLMKANQDG